MENFYESELNYEFTNNDRLFAFLATNSEISKLALKIQAAKTAKLNVLNLRKSCAANA